MPFNGSGGFTPLAPPQFPAVASTTINSTYFNNVMNDVFSGFGQVITRSGQSPWTANLPAGGFKISGLAVGSVNGDSVAFGQAAVTFGAVTGNVTGNVTGAASLNVLKAGDTMTGALVGTTASFPGGVTATLTGAASLNVLKAGDTMTGALAISTTGTVPLVIDSTNVAGGYAQFNLSGSPVGYMGSGVNLVTGAIATDFAVRAAIKMLFSIGATEAMRIDASGNVGIGAAPGAFKFDIAGGSGTHCRLRGGNQQSISFSSSVGNPGLILGRSLTTTDTNDFFIYDSAATATRLTISSTGVIADGAGNELGYRNIPRVDQAGGSAAAAVRGKMQGLTSTAAYTIPLGQFAGGDAFSICNFNAGAVSIVQGAGVTMHLGGTATTGNRTLAGFGIATVWWANGAECWISGAGVS